MDALLKFGVAANGGMVKERMRRDFSLRRPTASQERSGRPAPFEMTGGVTCYQRRADNRIRDREDIERGRAVTGYQQ